MNSDAQPNVKKCYNCIIKKKILHRFFALHTEYFRFLNLYFTNKMNCLKISLKKTEKVICIAK